MLGSSLTDTNAGFERVDSPTFSRLVVRPVRVVAFWMAIVLPFLHLSLLATGLDSQSSTIAFLVLVTANVAALSIGHPYGDE